VIRLSDVKVRAHRTPLGLFALGYPLIVLAMSVFGGTMYEIGLLWIPFAVPALIPVARELVWLYAGRRSWLFVIAGTATILLMKNHQDSAVRIGLPGVDGQRRAIDDAP
jgi:hypothetical protein